MKKHLKLFSLFFLATSIIAFAQGTVSGTVSDADGTPLPGATVVVQGTSSGVTTDFDGNYSINASSGDVLSYRQDTKHELTWFNDYKCNINI